MGNKRRMVLAGALFLAVSSPSDGAFAQSAPPQSKESKEAAKREEKERKQREKETAKQAEREAKAKRDLEKKFPINVGREYDRFKDLTSVRLQPMKIPAPFVNYNVGIYDLWIEAGYAYQGQVTRQPDTVILIFGTQSRGWSFAVSRDLTLLVDGERLSLGTTGHQGEPGSYLGSSWVREAMFVQLPYGVFNKIANAKAVEVQLGSFEFALTERHLEGLRRLMDSP